MESGPPLPRLSFAAFHTECWLGIVRKQEVPALPAHMLNSEESTLWPLLRGSAHTASGMDAASHSSSFNHSARSSPAGRRQKRHKTEKMNFPGNHGVQGTAKEGLLSPVSAQSTELQHLGFLGQAEGDGKGSRERRGSQDSQGFGSSGEVASGTPKDVEPHAHPPRRAEDGMVSVK